MTGTSVDGLDLALIQDCNPPAILAGRTFELPVTLRDDLLHLVHDDEKATIDLLGHTDVALGQFIGRAVLDFLRSENTSPADVAAIGSHGQTVRHRPSGKHAFTLQIGDPHHIAEVSGITTVADFRRRDMAAGGQGAPLVPAFHRALFADHGERRIVLNIGGIANVTCLSAGTPLTGFDTGPGNGLMDLWIQENLGSPLDTDGAWAASGEVDPSLLALALADPYFELRPPKSTGREYFNRNWLTGLFARHQLPVAAADVQATLLELTCASINSAVDRYCAPTDRLIVCGGGRKNRALLARLAKLCSCTVDSSEDWGVDGDSLEAAAFAWFAARAMHQQPAGEPSVTGARHARILGVIHPAFT